jgi:hypothetical protein
MKIETIYLISIAVALFVPLAVHRLTLWRDSRNAMRAVATAYRTAFADEVLSFQHDATGMFTLTDSFEKHRAAVTTALPLLSKRDRARVQRAWDDYCGKNDAAKELSLAVVIQGYSHPDFMQQGRHRFLVLSSALDHLAT